MRQAAQTIRQRTEHEKPEYAVLAIRDLKIDHAYQRELKEHFVKKLVKEWDDRACQPLTVHLKIDGEYHVVDGQHRLEAAARKGRTTIPCFVSLVESQAEEAKTFVGVNSMRLNMQGLEIFRGKLVAQDPEAVAIAAILERNGVRISNGPQTRGTSAASSIVKAYQIYGPHALEYAIRTIIKAYNGAASTLVGFLIIAVARFYARACESPRFDPERLGKMLAPVPLTDVRRRASARSPRGILSPEGAAFIMLDLYNTRLSGANRLDEQILNQSASAKAGNDKLTLEQQRQKAQAMNKAMFEKREAAQIARVPNVMPLSSRARIEHRTSQRQA